MSESNQDNYFHELSFYTLSHPDREYFIHQHIVDAFTAQTASENTKAISLVFSLVGLYLYLEKGYSGRQVQLAHLKLAKNKILWPVVVLPGFRGNIAISDVLKSTPGPERDNLIKKWCNSVWEAYKDSQSIIASLAKNKITENQQNR